MAGMSHAARICMAESVAHRHSGVHAAAPWPREAYR
jgi:hypothetical protein